MTKTNGHQRPEPLVTCTQAAAARPPCHRQTILQWIKEGRLPYERPSGYIFLVRMSDVDKILDEMAISA